MRDKLLEWLHNQPDFGPAREMTEALWRAGDSAKLASVYAKHADIDRWRINGLSLGSIQRDLIIALPAQLWADVYAAATDIEQKRELTKLVWDLSLVRQLIREAWKANRIDDVAVHYGGLFMDGGGDDYLSVSRGEDDQGSSMDGYPKPMLKALVAYDWPDAYAGIDTWLEDEVEDR